MIARIINMAQTSENVTVIVQYLDGTPPAEVGTSTFTFDPSMTQQQIKADIVAVGKGLRDRKVETDRIAQALQTGTEFTV